MPIFLDYQSTTPCDPRVVEAMLPYFTQKFGNPHSRSHAFGWEAEAACEVAREQVARLINADAKEIIFTSGATEANNIALKSVGAFYKEKKNHIITVQTEHKCVLDSARHMEMQGFEVTYLPVQTNGLIDLAQLKAAIKPTTLLVSVMAVNNELGVIQPLTEIGKTGTGVYQSPTERVPEARDLIGTAVQQIIQGGNPAEVAKTTDEALSKLQ